MYRQSKELYGTWEMLCGNEVQVRPRGLLRGPWGSPRAEAWCQAQRLWTRVLLVCKETIRSFWTSGDSLFSHLLLSLLTQGLGCFCE